ncbi:MAG: aspartate carbamoyltransferase [Clostridia bacterium]|nr:aspartate carbamoyltransferase [Clostridia bacterium]
MNHLNSIEDLSIEQIDELIEVAIDIINNPVKYQDKCAHKKLATLFFEPSTRTRLSFEAAMMELGGNVLGFSEANSSSAAKGESVSDTIQVVNHYADIIAMRHPKEGAPLVASLKSNVPIINAGDGGHNHPTQTLTDLLTIKLEKGRLDNLTIGLCGDLKYGRTVHSLITAMSRYENIKFIMISPKELAIPEYVKTDILDKNNIEYVETADLEKSMPNLDILYMTRIQRERFSDENEYMRLKDSYILTTDKLKTAKTDLSILHPLPRVNEIEVSVDEDEKRACYFRQARNGKYIRMALILNLLGITKSNYNMTNSIDLNNTIVDKIHCTNPRCITSTEQGLKPIFKLIDKNSNTYRCLYCDNKLK